MSNGAAPVTDAWFDDNATIGRGMLSAIGEPEIKGFVQASVDENLKLESLLRMLRTEKIVS